jgi:hypothetical protein
MNRDFEENLMVVLLNDMIQHNLPRILAIRVKMRRGEAISTRELEFMDQMLARINDCYYRFDQDAQCQAIFSTLAHLVSRVINRAYDNEQRERSDLDMSMAAVANA